MDRGTAELEFNKIMNTFPVATTFTKNYETINRQDNHLGVKQKTL